MAERGWRVRVLEAASAGHGASGNAAAILYPKLVSAALTPEHIQSIAYLHTLSILKDPRLAPHFQASGVLWLQTRKQRVEIGPDHPWWQRYVWPLDAEAASNLAGIALAESALWLPQAGLIHPAGLLACIFAHPNIELLSQHEVTQISPDGPCWQLEVQRHQFKDSKTFTADTLVLAVAGAAASLVHSQHLPLRPVRGQVSTMPAGLALKTTLCYGGYLTPEFHGQHVLGATFQPGRSDASPCLEDQFSNGETLLAAVPSISDHISLEQDVPSWRARASVRWQTPDYLPLVGWLPWPSAYEQLLSERVPSRPIPEPVQELPKIGISLGHGSKGFSQAWLAAEILCQDLVQEPDRRFNAIQERMRPDRFLIKAWKRGQLNTAIPKN